MKKFVIYLNFCLVLLMGCQANFNDISNRVNLAIVPVPDNSHVYGGTWLTETTIIFVKYLDREDFNHNYLVDPKSTVIMEELFSYDTETKQWNKILLLPNDECHAGDIGLLERLPNGNLGLVYSCRIDHKATIREFDVFMNNFKILFENNIEPNLEIGVVGSYAFSPDMKELIQEDATGNYLNNQLYHVTLGKEPVQIVPDFIRAMMPAWSPHNREIAFWGTQNYSDGRPEDFRKLPQILGLSGYPLDLYLSTPEGNNVHLVLSSVKDPGGIEWSPTKNVIAFSGEFDGIDGLWLLDPITSEITRIWNSRVGFYWSPDGTKIMTSYVEYSNYPKIQNVGINIIDVPQ